MKPKRLKDITIATRDLSSALQAWASASRLSPSVSSGSSAELPAADVVLRLVQSGPGGPEGLQSIALTVQDLQAAIADLRSKGIAVTEVQPTEGGPRSAMIEPGSAHGVPIRLVEEEQ